MTRARRWERAGVRSSSPSTPATCSATPAGKAGSPMAAKWGERPSRTSWISRSNARSTAAVGPTAPTSSRFGKRSVTVRPFASRWAMTAASATGVGAWVAANSSGVRNRPKRGDRRSCTSVRNVSSPSRSRRTRPTTTCRPLAGSERPRSPASRRRGETELQRSGAPRARPAVRSAETSNAGTSSASRRHRAAWRSKAIRIEPARGPPTKGRTTLASRATIGMRS